MLQDVIGIFKKSLDQDDCLILDNYIPKDGTYLMITMDQGTFICSKPLQIVYHKKTDSIEGETDDNYLYFKQLDYLSQLVEMNKPMDSKKIIHSNNYLTLFIKKENLLAGKVTREIIDGYFELLKDPLLKYEKKSKTKEIYQSVEEEVGKPDQALIEKIQGWVNEYLQTLDIDLSKKDYLKLFFVFPDQKQTLIYYQSEGKRYLIPNIYNNNDANQSVGGELFGLPNDNMGMNAKKPFLEHKSRKVKEPRLVTLEDALLQKKFFDYLLGKASVGKVNVYIESNEHKIYFFPNGEFPGADFKTGFFMRIKKGKEVEIHDYEMIPEYNFQLPKQFKLKQIIGCTEDMLLRFNHNYDSINTLKEMEFLIHDVFFSKWLAGNYFTDPGDLMMNDGVLKFYLLTARKGLWRWFYLSNSTGVARLLEQSSLALIKNSLANGYFEKAIHQLNVRWSLKDYFSKSKGMEEGMKKVRNDLKEHINSKSDWDFVSDEEYYYAVGQLLRFYISKIKSLKTPQSLVNPFLNAKNDRIIKDRLRQLYKKVNYSFEIANKKVNYSFEIVNLRVSNLISQISLYQPDEPVNQDILIGGFTSQSLIYEKIEEGHSNE